MLKLRINRTIIKFTGVDFIIVLKIQISERSK